jgi:hypothetical protein
MTLILDAMRSGIQWAPDFYNASAECQTDCQDTTSPAASPLAESVQSSDGYHRVPTPKKHVDMMMCEYNNARSFVLQPRLVLTERYYCAQI